MDSGRDERIPSFLPVGIRRIYVESLFGQKTFTYDLHSPKLAEGQAQKLILLYGDNGSGKTTILKLLFNVLSHVDKKGHKTAVAKVRFKTFQVDFADGTSVIATRSEVDAAAYRLSLKRGGETIVERDYGTDEWQRDLILAEASPREFIKLREKTERDEIQHQQILSLLKDLNPGAIYVTDSRRVYSTVPLYMSSEEPESDVGIAMRERTGAQKEGRSALSSAISQISSWATQKALLGSAQGEEDVNSAYAAIMKRLAQAPQLFDEPLSVDEIANTLHEQGRRSLQLVRFGLMKRLRVEEIVQSLRDSPPRTLPSMIAVLQPYITGIKARIDALEPIRQQLASFVDTINSFYRNKNIDLHASKGLRITLPNGEPLAPSQLSSGEGQLLYLFASTLVAKDRCSLFMIDEPELSLNVKWQRQILDSLLTITADSRVQFVFATHSIELLTRYTDFVLDLNTVQQPLFA